MSRRKNGTGSVCRDGNRWRLREQSTNGVQKELVRLSIFEYTKEEAYAILDYFNATGILLSGELNINDKELIETLNADIEDLSNENMELKSQILDLTTQLTKANFIIEKQKELLGHKNKKE